jgi:phosphate transport system permease protein
VALETATPTSNDSSAADAQRRSRALRSGKRRDGAVRSGLAIAGFIPGLALAFLAYEMIKEAYPSIRDNGTSFFTGHVFAISSGYSGTGSYGVLPLLWGTLISSLIALAIAVPVAVGGAILLVERIPHRLQGPLSVFLELLAGIPSVVFGLWGVFTFGPVLSRDIYKPIAKLGIPWFSKGVTPNGSGMLTASLVLCVMIIPIIASTTRELLRSVPQTSTEGAVALGLTGSEVVRVVTLPFVRTGILAAAFLGWGRALGETIAVLLISNNNSNGYPHSIFAGFTTMAASIAQNLDNALTVPAALHALAEVGLVLLAVTLLTNFAGRMIARKLSAGVGLPVGRGV